MHAYGVCDDEEYFYNFIDGIFADLGATPDVLGKGSQCMSSSYPLNIGCE